MSTASWNSGRTCGDRRNQNNTRTHCKVSFPDTDASFTNSIVIMIADYFVPRLFVSE